MMTQYVFYTYPTHNSNILRYSSRHPLDVTVSTTQCILRLTDRHSKFGVSKPVIIIDSCVFKSWFTSANLQCVSQTAKVKKLLELIFIFNKAYIKIF